MHAVEYHVTPTHLFVKLLYLVDHVAALRLTARDLRDQILLTRPFLEQLLPLLKLQLLQRSERLFNLQPAPESGSR